VEHEVNCQAELAPLPNLSMAAFHYSYVSAFVPVF